MVIKLVKELAWQKMKSHLCLSVLVLTSVSTPKHFDLISLKINLRHNNSVIVNGIGRLLFSPQRL